jgi:hypothetical protein
MNLFYKIHLQTFNAISIVLYHSGPTFGKVLYSCLDTFVVDASHYSGQPIRHLLNASEAFPTEWFLQFWEKVKVWWAEPIEPCLRYIKRKWTLLGSQNILVCTQETSSSTVHSNAHKVIAGFF